MYSGLLIGRDMVVVASLDKSLVKKNGIVIDETKHLLVLRTANGRIIKLPKSVVTLGVYDQDRKAQLQIKGSELVGTLEERIRG